MKLQNPFLANQNKMVILTLRIKNFNKSKTNSTHKKGNKKPSNPNKRHNFDTIQPVITFYSFLQEFHSKFSAAEWSAYINHYKAQRFFKSL